MISVKSLPNRLTDRLRRLLLLSLGSVGILTLAGIINAGISALSEADRNQLLKENFQLVHRVADLLPGVRQAFAEHAKVAPFRMADPGQPFQVTCMVTNPDLPLRRLIFAGMSPDYCFIHYEQGGIAYGFHVELFRLVSNGKANFIWEVTFRRAFDSLELLRRGIQSTTTP
jgi:hypothetical protein